ncbi:MAG: penicillin-binding protein activator LpoB [Spirochaetaceae bacterium]|jgi:hypothetical protein|nr:penicillin-binding protein activator LpoB [Spirochaetaceae bacterium]
MGRHIFPVVVLAVLAARSLIAAPEPRWIRSRELDYPDSRFISALGMGKGDKEAKQAALGNLAQILASEIANSGKYAVLLRTQAAIDTIMKEYKIQHDPNLTDRATASQLGKGLNAEYVLSGPVISLGTNHYFDVKILKIDGSMISGDARQYQTIADGLVLMPQLAKLLTGGQDEQERAEAQKRQQDVEQYLQDLEDESWPQDTASQRSGSDKVEASRSPQKANQNQEWKNKWLYVGLRGGVSLRNYTLQKDIPASSVDLGITFEGAAQLSFQFTRFLALQGEGIFTQDTVKYLGEGYEASFTSWWVMLPVALKLTFRPGPVLIAPFAGAYFNLPMGDAVFQILGSMDRSYRIFAPLGFMGGLDLGVKLGPGVLFLDARYGMDSGHTSLSDSGGTLQIYTRNMISLSVGYEFGLINRKVTK